VIPEFRLDPGHPVRMRMGGVSGLDELHLVWDV
jgi:hypothetical protein